MLTLVHRHKIAACVNTADLPSVPRAVKTHREDADKRLKGIRVSLSCPMIYH